jgi:hypothetical protein
MAKAKSKHKAQVKNLRPRVKGVDGRNVKGGFSKISPGEGSGGSGGSGNGGGIGDKIN